MLMVGIVAAAALVAGCGSAEETAGSAPLTKAQFIKQADAICAKFSRERKAAAAAWVKKFPGGSGEAEMHFDEAFRRIVAPSLEQESRELRRLAVPEMDAAEIGRMIEKLSGAGHVIAKQGYDGIYRSGIYRYAREASAYGLKTCASPLE